MTLLDLCVKNQINIRAAHVNYQKRATAKRDEMLVRNYCEQHNIPLHVAYCPTEYQGNFQAYARDFRYDFFKQLVQEYQLEGVLVAHQLDDHLETYLIQKKRKSIPLHYGLQKEMRQNGLRVVRPLLNMTKKQCYDYCSKHQLAYGEDESNFSDDYLRNRLRKEIALWSEQEKEQLLLEIQNKNEEKEKKDALIQKELDQFDEDLNIALFQTEKNPKEVLRAWLHREHVGYHCSEKYLSLICRTILENKKNFRFKIDEQTELVRSYEVVQLVKDVSYSYTFAHIQEFDCAYFKIRTEGTSMQAVTLSEEDFPITVRSPLPNDKIELRYGTKKVNRFFIDRKISHKERKCWPIVVNRVGNVIFVAEIGCDVKHYTNKANCFVVK